MSIVKRSAKLFYPFTAVRTQGCSTWLTVSPTQRYTDPPMQLAHFTGSAESTTQAAIIIKLPW